MRKFLSSPVKMALSDAENASYQNALKHVTELSLNLTAVKVENRPEDFLGWCTELIDVCRNRINMNLLEEQQLPILKKLEQVLVLGASVSQFKMARIAPWPIFTAFIEQQASLHALEERLALLDYIQLIKVKSLTEMTELERLAFAGKHTNQHCHTQFNFDVEWFASTKGAKVFHTLLAQQPESFDLALSHIPESGDVTPKQYQKFVSAYKKIFTRYTVEKKSGEKAPLAPATRLLAMKRPDQFIALTNAKIDVLCQGLSIAKFNAFDFDSYWRDMIGTLRTFAWWHQIEPEDEREAKLWQVRAVLVDLFMFADEDFAFGSNYLRIRDKKLNSVKSTYKSTRRSRVKLTHEEVVEQALAQEGIPDYVQTNRDTILKQVKAGKDVEHVIGLMRAIFG
ncbi:hypothetical protein CMT41_06230 [Colwellia sp. MT41]|uniref:hypothetical protein n=1 Tax=Colwellia sp. MT41 TaxID=58049 RepID=UPI00071766DC|nr:hypothetical protein [Colwellia sp. MT41]ALO34371.1 hypothetical protein CMT41_06230 [Colwellia sp. MT41]